MKPLRVLALVPEGQIPPDDVEGLDEKEVAKWKMEYDVIGALGRLGHEVQLLDVTYDLTPMPPSSSSLSISETMSLFEMPRTI